MPAFDEAIAISYGAYDARNRGKGDSQDSEEISSFVFSNEDNIRFERLDMTIDGITPKQKLALAAWLLLLTLLKNGGITIPCESAAQYVFSSAQKLPALPVLPA